MNIACSSVGEEKILHQGGQSHLRPAEEKSNCNVCIGVDTGGGIDLCELESEQLKYELLLRRLNTIK